MFAIVDIAGHQLKVSPAERVFVPKLPSEVGTTLKFDRVLLLSNDKSIKIGNPVLKGVSVKVKVLGHAKDEKVTVVKKKRRKGYRLLRGHRQQYTEVEITEIG